MINNKKRRPLSNRQPTVGLINIQTNRYNNESEQELDALSMMHIAERPELQVIPNSSS